MRPDLKSHCRAAEPELCSGNEPTQTRHAVGTLHTQRLRSVQFWSSIPSSRSLDFSSCQGGHPPGWGASAVERRELQFPASATRGRCPSPPAAVEPLEVPAATSTACKMSVRQGQRLARPGTSLSWWLCCSTLLFPAAGYVIVSSLSWAVPNEVDEELDRASTEEAMPAHLEDSSSFWQRSFPTSAHKKDPHLPPAGTARTLPPAAPPGMFSYPHESGSRLRPGTARFLAHASTWGCLATVSAQEKVSHLRELMAGACLAGAPKRLTQGTGRC